MIENRPAEQPIAKCYESIAVLPLRNFIDAIVDHNLAALVVSGNPNDQQLQIAWQTLSNEYAETIGDRETQVYLSLLKETTLIFIELSQIEILIEMLRVVHYPDFCVRLNEFLRTSLVFDPEKPEEYQAQLKRCWNRSRSLKIDYAIKMGQFEAIQKKNETEGSPATREYFQSLLITLSDHAKYPVLDSITVFEFCERIRRYNIHSENLSKQRNHG